jgi:hypothetical protein
MTPQTERYTYQFNGRDGTFDLIEIVNPKGEAIASLYYWDEPDTDEAIRVEKSARVICKHLNYWHIGGEPEA